MDNRTVVLTGDSLTVEKVAQVAIDGAKVEFAPAAQRGASEIPGIRLQTCE